MNLQSIFNQILLGEKVEVLLADKKEFDSLRTMLIRKFKKAAEGMESIGDYNPYKGMFVSASWNKETNVATFCQAEVSSKKRKSYTTIDV